MGAPDRASLKLNLGCGQNRLPGFVNVDKHGAPDVRQDLEAFPWPWPDSAVDEVVLNHVLEHLGAQADIFMGILRELYRVCRPEAIVRVNVPHPRHDHFIGDPTHVRVITPELLALFSKANCRRWAAEGAANSPLALYHDVDFEIADATVVLERRYLEAVQSGALTEDEVHQALKERNNVATEYRIVLRVVKDLKTQVQGG